MKKFLSKRHPLLFRPSTSFSEVSRFQNSFLSPANLVYIESLYEQWIEDKSSVSPSFAAYFELLEKGQDPHEAYAHPSSAGQTRLGSKEFKEISKQIKMRMMIEGYRSLGHHFAKLDPLYLPQNKDLFGKLDPKCLAASSFGYQEDEMAETITVKNLRGEGA